jgi:hypothetical protein
MSDNKFNLNSTMHNSVVTETQLSLFSLFTLTNSHSHRHKVESQCLWSIGTDYINKNNGTMGSRNHFECTWLSACKNLQNICNILVCVYVCDCARAHVCVCITKGHKIMKVYFSQHINAVWNHKTQYMTEGRISYHKEEEEIILT